MSLDLIPRRWNNKGQPAISHDDDIVDNTPEQDNTMEQKNENENDNATITLQGSIRYKNLSPWPIKSKYNVGAMGPIGYLLKSFLECYHDVLSFDHTIIGKLIINNTHIEEFYDSDYNDNDYDYATDLNLDDSGNEKEEVACNNNEDNNNSQQCDAAITDSNHNNNNNVSGRKTNTNTNNNSSIISRGYVEKDRGRSFPSLWIWIQTNSFPNHIGTSLFFSYFNGSLLDQNSEFEFPGFTAAVWLNSNNNNNNNNDDDPTITTATETATATNRLIPFATWTGAFFEKLTIDDERVVIELNSGSIRKGLIIYYRLELIVNRKNVRHIMLYAPTTTTTTTIINGTSSLSSSTSNASTTTTTTISSKMKPFVNEALNAKVHLRLYEYYYDDNDNNINDGDDDDTRSSRERVRLLIDDIGEHAGLEIHQNVQYLVDNLCGKPTANRFVCL
ncbi:hypothetical protein FRACYDRAFT_241400 [Fragilariopsis cylindrus CCMP1102]|uniref:Uncharacterized protein n=1 Tax=Fragilariopsis cylindrus CCMP1102 TaxID=635003 RepID=A0A1E7FAH2_9STRA|nr:hypothetical protein FRACYDRAFT_241400 [Fragilariopsis cylindrus CCMP1102]|eukprot:OEU14843.1 hypothetical protein FRACYDRAFT_241400 [Fragilariopsis cylindrus CCMP1102]